MWTWVRRAALFISVCLAAACGGGGDGGTIFLGGSVRGLLEGNVVVLEDATAGSVDLHANGAFQFPDPVASGSTYAVHVAIQPPGQDCTVSNGTGQVGTDSVRNIEVDCARLSYHVLADVSGLMPGRQAVLQLPAGATMPITANGVTRSTVALASGTVYQISVLRQPAGQTCVVENGSGTVGNADVEISLSCRANAYTVTAQVSGLLPGGGLVLQNQSHDLRVGGNGPATFAEALDSGDTYAVTVVQQPVGQQCTVSNGNGTIVDAPIDDVLVDCAALVYNVGVTVVGRAATSGLVLQNNGGDDLAAPTSGARNFATSLASQAPYNVTVKSQPAGVACMVFDGAGVVGAANVNVYVACPSRVAYAPSRSMPTRILGRYIDETTGGLLPSFGSPYESGVRLAGLAAEGGGRFLYAASDRSIVTFSIDPSNGSLTQVRTTDVPVDIDTLDGIHAVVSGRFLHATSGSSTYAYRIDTATGGLALVAGSPFATGRFGASAETLLYTIEALGLQQAIGAYRIDPVTGTISRVVGSPFGEYGGDDSLDAIALDPSGRFIYAERGISGDGYDCPRGSSHSYTIDSATGALTGPATAGEAVRGIDAGGRFAYGAYAACRDGTPAAIYADSIDQATYRVTRVNSIDVNQSPFNLVVDQAAPFIYSEIGTLQADPVTGGIVGTFRYAGDFVTVVPRAFATLGP